MLTLFREGGVPMFAVLLFGLLALGAAAIGPFRRAAHRRYARAARRLVGATVFATLSGVAADLAAVGHHVSARYESYRAELPAVLLQGLAESLAPAILGFSLAALTAFVLAVFPAAGADGRDEK